MKHIYEWISKGFAILLGIYVLSLIVTTDTCTRVHRSSIPVLYSFRLVDFLTQNWTSTDTKITMLKAEIASAVFIERIFEKTFGDVTKNESGDTVYVCNPEVKKAEEQPANE